MDGRELHYWDQEPRFELREYLKKFGRSRSGQKIGEITPAYGRLEPRVIHEIHNAFPALKTFYTLRNPIQRAWAQLRMRQRKGLIDIDTASDSDIIDLLNNPLWVAAGNYEANIRNWRSVFAKDQLLLLFFEDVQSDPRGVLQRVATHIGVEPAFFDDHDLVPDEQLRQPVFNGPQVPIRSSIADYLRAQHENNIRSLGIYLGRDLTSWIGTDDSFRG